MKQSPASERQRARASGGSPIFTPSAASTSAAPEVSAMRARMLPVAAPEGAIDIVGTGGDHSGSYNVSTLAAILTARDRADDLVLALATHREGGEEGAGLDRRDLARE
jgi:hypothetical protein